MQEAQNVANEVAQQVDTSGYSEATPGPNGRRFPLAMDLVLRMSILRHDKRRAICTQPTDSGNPLGLVVAARFPSGRLKLESLGKFTPIWGLVHKMNTSLDLLPKMDVSLIVKKAQKCGWTP